jgi:hypothetical protein
MVHELEILGDPEEPRKVAAKYLRVVPKKFVPVAVSIESVLDTTNMSIEEITGRLRAVEGRGDEEEADPPTGAGGKLLLTEEQWLARMKDKQPGEGSSKSGAGKSGAKNRSRITKRRRTAVEARTTVTPATTAARKGIGQRIVVRRERSRPTSLARTMRSLC